MVAKKTAFYGVLLALALLFSYVESLFSLHFIAPGVKLGMANLAVLFVLYRRGWKQALALNLGRILLAGLLFGNALSLLYALSGGTLSLFVMAGLHRTGRFGVCGVSMAGGVVHNAAQLACAALVLQTAALWYYLPVLLLAGLAAGFLIGLLSGLVFRCTQGLPL